jgi:transposase-like protein
MRGCTHALTVTLKEDFFRRNLLYLPVGSILFLVWLGIGFEVIEPFIRVNPLLLIALGAPGIYAGTRTITDNFIFVNNKVAYGPCPSCEAENRIYFGDILGVEGFKDIAEVKCPNCKTEFTVQRNTLRASTLPK